MRYMTFSNMGGVGSECGPSNGLTRLMKQVGQDQSLQQDRFSSIPQGESSKTGFRSNTLPPSASLSSDNLANEFFKQEQYGSPVNRTQNHFSFDDLSQELEKYRQGQDWSREFTHSPEVNDFENIYHQTSPPLPPSAIHHHPAKYNNWSEEFTDYHSPPHQQHYSRTASASDVSEEEQLAFEKIFNEVNDQRDWDKEFADHESWEQNYNQQQQSIPVLAPQPNQPTVMSSNIPIIRNQPLFRSSSDMLDKKDWSQEFSKYHDLTADEMQPAQSVENEDWIQQYQKSMENRDKQVNEQECNGLEKEWNRLKPEGKTYGYRAIHPEYQKYNYMASNPYLLRPAAIDGVIHTSLADSILALEAKTQLNSDDAKTWEQLGLKQQENEQDAAAITALEKAVSLDPTCMDAWMALAVSYTNEHCRMDAFNCLEQWIHNSDTYKQILDGEMLGKNHSDQEKRHAYITDLFLKAARFAPGEEMDADVQVGLGVLFHMSEEYEKAIDCFKAALISRPQDYQLWNKVGATLANSRDSHGAIEMYFNALQINPSFVRARYNLAISCMHLGQYRESAEHLLNALALQRTAAFSAGEAARMDGDNSPIDIPNDTSDGIWDSLRLLMYMISREDLAQQCNHHNLDAFRGHFDF